MWFVVQANLRKKGGGGGFKTQEEQIEESAARVKARQKPKTKEDLEEEAREVHPHPPLCSTRLTCSQSYHETYIFFKSPE